MVYCICFACNNVIVIQLCNLISTFYMIILCQWRSYDQDYQITHEAREYSLYLVISIFGAKRNFLTYFSLFCMCFYAINHSKTPIFFLIVLLWFYASKCCLYPLFEVKPSRTLCCYLSSIFQPILVKFCSLLPLIYLAILSHFVR